MGVARTDYVMMAMKWDCCFIEDEEIDIVELYEDNGYTQKITEYKGLTVVSDGMNGKYTFIDKVLAKAINYEGLPPIDCYTKKGLKKIKSLITDQFGIHLPNVKVWVFTHWH